MVNIIMPAYNSHDTIRQAIGSVVMQDELENILLTIVDNCSELGYEYLIKDFNYMKIEILRKNSNTGCGQSRQYGIDHCKCKYFMFLDTDDVLYSPDAVKKMHYYMEENELDFLYTDFIEEKNDNEYIIHQNDGVWMHGKMFRTEYIRNNGITFSNTRLHEDHAFNIIASALGGRNLYIDYTTYMWKKNLRSLTNSPSHTFINAMTNFLKNAEYTLNELSRRNIDKSFIVKVVKVYILSFYKHYNSALINNVPQSEISDFIGMIASFCRCIPKDMRNILNRECFTNNFFDNIPIQSMYENNIAFLVGFNEYYELIKRAMVDN